MIEYPKCLYAKNGDTVTVQNHEEESRFAAEGWMTAAHYHAHEVVDTKKDMKKKAAT